MPGGVPMTMQTFAITSGCRTGAKLSTVSSVIYLLLGAVGVPVLMNFPAV
ncbi:MAG: biotin transporter BioY [Butyricicoccus sp.]